MKSIRILAAIAAAGVMVGATGCASTGRKVTVVEEQPAGTTTIVRETAREVKKTTYHPTQISEPEMKVAPDSELK